MEEASMRAEYDFSKAKPNPYLTRLRKPTTAKADTGDYEMQMEDTGAIYLSDCVAVKETIKTTLK
jgi:hypothetical protein